DGRSHDGVWVVVSNARRYGGRFLLAPTADIGTAEFEVTVFSPGSRLDLLRYVGALICARVSRCRGVIVERGSCIELEGTSGLHVDGDVRGCLPAHVVASGEMVPLLHPPA